jgi:ribonuclease inhibitor
MRIEIDGRTINSEHDFHRAVVEKMDVGPYYGHNLDALWDRLSTDVERPVLLIWLHAEASKQNLGEDFDRIVTVLRRVEEQDANFGWEDRFSLQLR